MGGVPPGVIILLAMALAALAGALVTWILIYPTREGRGQTKDETSQEGASSSDELLRVSRKEDGLAVFVQGEPRRHLGDIRDQEVAHQAIVAVKAVLAFAEGWLPARLERPGGSRPAGGRSVGGEASFLSQPRGRTQVASDELLETPMSEPLNLVEEIDALVQERLRGRPDLAARDIRLTEDATGRPLICVGQQRYRSAGAIPDEEVRILIQETIQAWEEE